MAKSSPYALLPETDMYTQAQMKDEKDSSKNLVSGDFEREYREGMVEKPGVRRGRACVATLAAAIAVVFVWLLALTVVREIQLSKLRHEVAQLSANMIAMEATVKNLNQKVSNNRLDELKFLEDTIYADDVEQDGSATVEDGNGSSEQHQYQKLDGLTVLESEGDDEMDDDDDEYTDEESGDWYPDYDRRREKIGRTNMVKLKPEDFTGSMVLGKDKSAIREIKRMLNENPEMPDIALVAATASASSGRPTESDERAKRSVFPDSPLDSIDEFAAPRSIIKPDERRVPKKFMPSPTMESPHAARLTATHTSRIARNSEDQVAGERRPFIAAHFHGNTSHLNSGVHEHYKGNGLVRLAHGQHHDVWYPSPWTLASPQRPTLTQNGHVHVHHTGVYLVYVQIYYLDSHDTISWVLHRTNADIDGRETLLQCAQSAHSPEPMDKPNSCFSAAALFLKKGDRLAVRNTGGGRHSLMQPEKSFIGLIQLADTIDPDQEL